MTSPYILFNLYMCRCSKKDAFLIGCHILLLFDWQYCICNFRYLLSLRFVTVWLVFIICLYVHWNPCVGCKNRLPKCRKCCTDSAATSYKYILIIFPILYYIILLATERFYTKNICFRNIVEKKFIYVHIPVL